MRSSPIALDACVLINLCATGHLPDIAEALGVMLVVAREASRETLYLRSADSGDPRKTGIDLQPLIADNVLEIADLRGAELATFVAAAEHLDDGEAATLALAVHRDHLLATDDRAALRLIVADHTDVGVRSTSQLLRRYCEAVGASAEHAAACLAGIERRASFRPPGTDPEAAWWESVARRGG